MSIEIDDKFYCKKLKRNFQVLGYFGGGPVNFGRFEDKAEAFAIYLGCNARDIYISEIFASRRVKGYKVLWWDKPDQEPLYDANQVDNFWKYVE